VVCRWDQGVLGPFIGRGSTFSMRHAAWLILLVLICMMHYSLQRLLQDVVCG
jgi:hypothetical protein